MRKITETVLLAHCADRPVIQNQTFFNWQNLYFVLLFVTVKIIRFYGT